MLVGMPAVLLERQDELAAMVAAVAAARRGRGTVVLVSGEAGIGKSALLRRFLDEVAADVRVLFGACDDLLAPRALGPLRDAARGTGGPLERALDGPVEGVFPAVLAQLSGAPTVLAVDDVQWADDTTLDVLRYLARRIAGVPGVLVLSYREDAGVVEHPVRDLLGGLAGVGAVRLRPAPLSLDAVTALARAADRDGAAVHAATRGNPFYVTEALAAPPDETPAGVADAVLARLRAFGPECVAALQQLSVVPTAVEFGLAEALLGERLAALAQAEERGIVEARGSGLAFRHELARRAVESALPGLRRRTLNRRVVAVLREAKVPDLERLVHHAVQADDAETVVEFAPRAAREAAAAGSHRQALAHLEAAVAHRDRLAPPERARLLAEHSWELYIAHRFGEAAAAGRDAVRQAELVGDPVLVGTALVQLSRQLFMTGDGDEAERVSTRAVEVLRGEGSPPALASAGTHHGAMLTLTGRTAEAVPVLRAAVGHARAAARADLESLALNYLGLARSGCGEPVAGEADLRAGLALALASGQHEAAARAYVNLGEMLYSIGDWPAVADVVEAGLAFADEHGLGQFRWLLRLHRLRLRVHRGEWDAAEPGLRELVEREGEPGMFDTFALTSYGRLLARRGRPEAVALLDRAWAEARRMRLPLGMSHAGIGLVELEWLTGRPGRAAEVAEALLPMMGTRGWAYLRGALLRNLARAGRPVEADDGLPEAFAAGLRGDWRAAAAAWERLGDPYERALELAGSTEAGPVLEALRVLDDLRADAAAAVVRRRLRELGVHRPPPRRPPDGRPRRNPGGLTARQLDVLELLAQGATNAEIAARLVLSVRTVDHHVAAILARLGARSRREAVATARALEAAERG
jgi:DNA-binding CsgD family transcriptional regulator/tetratricopeptide (TPR) repeat protein